MNETDVKFFLLAVGTPKNRQSNDISVNCPLCGDNKARLHMYKKPDMDQALCRCFNAGCDAETHRGLNNFLKDFFPHLLNSYQKEKFKKDIGNLQQPNLNNILASIKPVEKPVEKPTRKKFVLPPLFKDELISIEFSDASKKYLNNRKIFDHENIYFCRSRFINIFDKSYFVDNFIFLPLIYDNALQGFYTRSIEEKRFSTIIFPNRKKIWTSKEFDPSGTVYAFEGIFDAISSGLKNTVAMLSADLDLEVKEDIAMNGGKVVYCLDRDKTGIEKSIKYVKAGNSVFVWPNELKQFKDMNESICANNDLIERLPHLIEKNIYSGTQAIVLLNLSLYTF